MRALVLAALVAAPALAQPDLVRPPAETPAPSVAVDFAYAIGDDFETFAVDDQGNVLGAFLLRATSLALAIRGRYPLGGGLTVEAEVPFTVSHMRADGGVTVGGGINSDSDTGVSLGNPYLGVSRPFSPALTASLGVRLALASFEPAFVEEGRLARASGLYAGGAADQERIEAYLPDVVTFAAGVVYRRPVSDALAIRLHGAPALLVDVDGVQNDMTSVAVGYGAHADLALGTTRLSLGGTGRQVFSDEFFQFYETDLTAVVGASFEVGPVRPALTARVPLLGDYALSDAAVGVSLGVPLR